MQWSTTIALALAALGEVDALIRFPCAQLVIDRRDPLVNPGQVPSPHLHQIVGGVSISRVFHCEASLH